MYELIKTTVKGKDVTIDYKKDGEPFSITIKSPKIYNAAQISWTLTMAKIKDPQVVQDALNNMHNSAIKNETKQVQL